jgi:hypothetical protein
MKPAVVVLFTVRLNWKQDYCCMSQYNILQYTTHLLHKFTHQLKLRNVMNMAVPRTNKTPNDKNTSKVHIM